MDLSISVHVNEVLQQANTEINKKKQNQIFEIVACSGCSEYKCINFEAGKLREISGLKGFMQIDLELLYHHGSGRRWIASKNRVKTFHLPLSPAACS